MALELKKYTNKVASHLEYQELLTNMPYMKGRTVFDTLTSLTDLTLAEYPFLLQAKKSYKSNYLKMINQIKFNRPEDLISLLNIEVSDSDTVNSIYMDLSEDGSDDVEYSLEFALSIFPEKYIEKIGKFDLIVLNDKQIPYTTFNDTVKEVKVSYNDNPLIMISQIAHEVSHMVENYNPEIKKYSSAFLKERMYNKTEEMLSEFCEDHGLEYVDQAKNVNVIPGAFIDPYIGRIYGDLNLDPNTEVFSVGVQAMVLNPINFLFKDPEHFILTYKLLKGEL